MKRFIKRQIRRVRRLVGWIIALIQLTLLTIYLVIARSFYYVLAGYLLLYFFVNTSYFTRTLNDIVRHTMPGTMYFGQVTWGPLPWKIQVFHWSATPPDDEPIIRAQYVNTSMNLYRLVKSLAGNILWGDNYLELRFEGTTVYDSHTRLVFDDRMNFIFLSMWNYNRPSGSDGLYVELVLPDIKLVRGKVHLRFPFATIDVVLDDLTSKVFVSGSRTRVYGPTINIRRGKMTFFPGTAEINRKPLVFEWKKLRISSFFTDGREIRIDKAHGFFPLSGINFSGYLMVGDPLTFDLKAKLDLKTRDQLVRQFIGDKVSGRLRADFRLYGAMDDVAASLALKSPLLNAFGTPIRGLDLSGIFYRDYLANQEGEYVYYLKSLNAGMFGGHVEIKKASYKPKWTVVPAPVRRGRRRRKPREVSGPLKRLADGFEARIKIKDLKPEAIFRFLLNRAGVKNINQAEKRLPFINGRVNGTITLNRDRNNRTITTGLSLKVTQPKKRRANLLAQKYALNGNLDLYVKGDPPPQELVLDPARMRLFASRLRLVSGRDRLGLNGWYEPSTEKLDLRVSLGVGRLKEFLGTFGIRRAFGKLRLADGRVWGTTSNPMANFKVAIDDAGFDETRLGVLTAGLHLRNGLLKVNKARITPDWARRVSTSFSIRLFHNELSRLSTTMPLTVTSLDVEQLDIEKVWRKSPIKGVIDLDDFRIKTTAVRFLPNLDLSGRISGRNLTAYGERLRQIRLQGSVNRRQLVLRRFAVNFGLGAQLISGNLSYDRRGKRLTLGLNTRRFSVRSVKWLRASRIPLYGDVTLKLRATGPLDGLRISGTVGFDKLRYDKFHLGTARLQLVDRGPGQSQIRATTFFHDLTLLSGARLRWKGFLPTGFKARIQASKKKPLDLSALLPLLKKYTKRTRFSGDAEIDFDLKRRHSLSARIIVPKNGLVVSIDNISVFNVNRFPATLTYENGEFGVAGLDVLSVSTRMLMENSITPEQLKKTLSVAGILDRRNNLHFTLKGNADLAALRTFPIISSISGNVGVDLKVNGTLSNPMPSGSIVFGTVRVLPRGFGREIQIRPGSVLRLSAAGRSGWQKLWIDKEKPLKGTLDDGSFSLTGKLEFDRWIPTDVQFKLQGADIFYKQRGEYRVALHPDLRFKGTNILDPEKQDMRLDGNLRVIEGEYNRSFAQFTESLNQILGGSRRTKTYSKPLDEIFPWIKHVKLALNVVGQNNFFIRSRLNFGKTDLEIRSNIKVSGTYEKPRVQGRITLLEGSLHYGIINRVFELDRGRIDFEGNLLKPRVDVKARTEVTYEWSKSSQRRISLDDELLEGEEVTVNVIIHITGVFPKLNIKFSTDGSRGKYTQSQLISLVTFGYPVESGNSQIIGLNLTTEIFSLVPKLFLGAFVDELSLGLSEQLGVKLSLVKRFGKTLKFKTRVTQTGEDSKYQAGFQFKLTDRLSLEGRFRINRKDNTQKYDGKLRYRIPLN